ncbi:hypothetical protein EVAR_56582_1 [Eumeta japonica]|uniref:BED-type domain-containing protein n=1 Tax=Eumeta variegata TaxID=151549 RepID=A0A4C1Z1M7_EUMVA|nr:hypothetical protein EVAR_56582_1 [Eumeta japonica]
MEAKECVKRRKNEIKERYDRRFSDDFRENLKLFWQMVKQAQSNSETSYIHVIRDDDGHLLNEENMECVASPWLFNLFMDSCLYDLREYECGLRMDELFVESLLSADDRVIRAPSACGLQEMVNKINDSLKKRGMKSRALIGFDRTRSYTCARRRDHIKLKQQASLARSRDSCLDLYVRFSLAVGRHIPMKEQCRKKITFGIFFEKSTSDLSKAKCNKCHKLYSLGSSEPKRQTIHGLKLHLSKFHGEENRQYLKRQAEKEEQKLEAKLKRRKSEISIATGSTNSSSGGQLVQTTIFKMEQARALKASMWPDDHEISRRIDKSIMDLIIVDMLPYSIVDSEAFRRLNFTDPHSPQKYNFKSEKYFRTTLMPQTYEIV